MILLIISMIVVFLGIILIIVGDKKEWYENDAYYGLGFMCLLVGGIALFIMILLLLLKPLDYTKFKIKYEAVENMITNKDDIRDATYTNNLLEINEDILTCRAYINNNFVGIFHNKDICNTELLSKEKNVEEK